MNYMLNGKLLQLIMLEQFHSTQMVDQVLIAFRKLLEFGLMLATKFQQRLIPMLIKVITGLTNMLENGLMKLLATHLLVGIPIAHLQQSLMVMFLITTQLFMLNGTQAQQPNITITGNAHKKRTDKFRSFYLTKK